ncbi:hypothetical protein [Agrobacterium tumefaciens]|uniref:hypothetical protein n=1 Tax=Agrobacterium tumefaciens TaxID=358 RepID=UPI003B9E7CF8
MQSELTRPIVGIESRTAQEVFDIMCDRFKIAMSAAETIATVAEMGAGGMRVLMPHPPGSADHLPIGTKLYAAPPSPSVAVKALADEIKKLGVSYHVGECMGLADWAAFEAGITKGLEAAAEKVSALSAQVQDMAEGKELSRFELWFFQHLSDDQRTALFALNGYPTTGMDTHGKQKIALKHWFSRLPAAPPKQEGGNVTSQ